MIKRWGDVEPRPKEGGESGFSASAQRGWMGGGGLRRHRMTKKGEKQRGHFLKGLDETVGTCGRHQKKKTVERSRGRSGAEKERGRPGVAEITLKKSKSFARISSRRIVFFYSEGV